MPFSPELQARIDAVRASQQAGEDDDELARMKAKLARRAGRPGYSANTKELEERIAQFEGESE